MISEFETIGTDRFHRIDGGDVALWSAASALVLTLLAGAVWAYVRLPTDPAGPAAPPPMVMIEFAEIAMAPDSEEQIEINPEPEAMEQEEIAEIEAPEPEPEPIPEPEPQPEPEPEIEPDMVEAPEPEPEPEDLPEPGPAPEIVEDPLPEPEDLPEPVEPEPEPVEEIVPDLLESETAEVTLPAPMPADIRQLRETTPATMVQPRPQHAQQAVQQRAPASAPAQPAPQAAAPQTVVNSSAPNISQQQWEGRVRTHLDRNKRYPSEARNQRQEGVPFIDISIDAAGRVLGVSLIRSSGFPLLDQAAIDMAHRASPLPAPPASIAGQPRISFGIPVHFSLRR